ncbi:MAG: NFACT RNA binding domain-containing protein [Gemmatimonadota bacterium]
MSSRWDSVLVRAVAGELGRRLGDARLRALYFDRSAPAAYAFFRTGTLEIRLDGPEPSVLWRAATEPYPGSRSLPARVTAVSSPPDERRLTVELRRVRGAPREQRLEIELIPRRSNVFLVSGGRVAAALRADPLRSTGEGYQPPEPSRRRWAEVTPLRAEWDAFIASLPGEERETALVRELAWSSPINAAELLDADGGFELWRTLQRGADPAPTLLLLPAGPQPYPHPLGSLPSSPLSDLLDAGPTPPPPSLPSDVLRRAEQRVEELARKERSLERQTQKAERAEVMRTQADLLLARLHQVPRGAERLVLEGFAGEPVEMRLDPSMTAQENAQALYAQARKAERALRDLPGRLAATRAAKEQAAAALERLRSGHWGPEELRPLLRGAVPGSARGRPGSQAPLPYRRYTSSGGLAILVGKGARQNDQLTFHVARPAEVWLHAQGVPGAHVLLRWDRDEAPPARDLDEAAALAALHSAARHSAVVPVDWTRRRYVRKPRGSKPGSVVLERGATLMARPDPDLAERLQGGEDGLDQHV